MENKNTFFHKFSQAATALGKTIFSQADRSSNHNVYANKVRVPKQDLPFITTPQAILKYNKKEKKLEVFSAYSEDLKYNKWTLSEVDHSNHQTFVILDNDEILQDFVAPGDVIKKSNFQISKTENDHNIFESKIGVGEIAQGYTAQLFDGNNKIISNIHYTFDYHAGILTINKDYVDKIDDFNNLKLAAFKYIGPVITETIGTINAEINSLSSTVSILKSNLSSEVENFLEDFKSQISSSLSDIQNNFSEKFNNFKHTVSADISEFSSDINSTIDTISGNISTLYDNVDILSSHVTQLDSSLLGIQPFVFYANYPNMKDISIIDIKKVSNEYTNLILPENQYMVRYTFQIPGFCFNVQSSVYQNDISGKVSVEGRTTSIITRF